MLQLRMLFWAGLPFHFWQRAIAISIRPLIVISVHTWFWMIYGFMTSSFFTRSLLCGTLPLKLFMMSFTIFPVSGAFLSIIPIQVESMQVLLSYTRTDSWTSVDVMLKAKRASLSRLTSLYLRSTYFESGSISIFSGSKAPRFAQIYCSKV